MYGQIIQKADLTEITGHVIKEGKIQVLPYSFYEKRDPNELMCFMHTYAIYVLPTTELIDWLRREIEGTAIEIGCGNGAIGRALGIPFTDSKLQERPEIKRTYQLIGQPTITYPSDVIEMDGNTAVKHYQPDTVIAAFVTHKFNGIDGNMYGVEESKILPDIRKYISISNAVTHTGKPILRFQYFSYKYPWLITRSEIQEHNRIWVFPGSKQ